MIPLKLKHFNTMILFKISPRHKFLQIFAHLFYKDAECLDLALISKLFHFFPVSLIIFFLCEFIVYQKILKHFWVGLKKLTYRISWFFYLLSQSCSVLISLYSYYCRKSCCRSTAVFFLSLYSWWMEKVVTVYLFSASSFTGDSFSLATNKIEHNRKGTKGFRIILSTSGFVPSVSACWK